MSNVSQLRDRLSHITCLRQAASVVSWDQQTYMPAGAAKGRSEQVAALRKLTHSLFVADETGKLIEEAENEVGGRDLTDLEFQIVRMTRYDFDRALKLPTEFVAESAKTTSMAESVWAEARRRSDFAMFAPWLEKNLEIAHKTVGYLGYDEQPYDALLGQYEPKMKTREVQHLFETVRPVVVEMVATASQTCNPVNTSMLHRHYAEAAQEQFSKDVVAAFGYDFNRGRLDRTVHPFATSLGRDDVRITTRFHEDFLPAALMGTMHEAGHAMYEQNVGEDVVGTTLADGCSNSLHESQSRLWENIVGRSFGFWKYFFPLLQATFPEALEDVGVAQLYRALNEIRPSLIRVEADEVTYNLHIILRFELEQDLLNGKLAVKDAPDAWNSKMKAYLGITPPSDREGVLQDIHWAMGGMGYFPTYSLGNFLSAQLYEKALSDQPEIADGFERGNFSALFEWLKQNVWTDARRYFPQEQTVRSTGRPLETAPYLKYLKSKFGQIYGI